MTGARRVDAGFTLVEVVVALGVFALIAAAGVAILSFSLRAGRAADARLDDGAALARTVALLSADLGQAVGRPTRGEDGVRRPAFVGAAAAGAAPMLAFVRGGWADPDGAARPGLQKVAWQLDHGALQRVAWGQLDGAAPLAAATLLDGVADVRLRYRLAGAWSDRWDGARAAAPLPQAVEVTIVRAGGARWHELFPVGGGGGPRPVATPIAGAPPRA